MSVLAQKSIQVRPALCAAIARIKQLKDGTGNKRGEVHDVEEVQDEKLVVEKSDAGVAQPDTVVIDTQSALVARGAVFGARRHNLFASVAKGELADFGDQLCEVLLTLLLRLKGCRRVQLQQFHVHFDTEGELIYRAVGAARDVLLDG